MNRLTERNQDGHAEIIGEEMEEWTRCDASFDTVSHISNALAKLAAFEDTGLEPEEIVALANGNLKSATVDIGSNLYDLAVTKVFQERFGVSLDRLCELAKADKDKRCIILSCKVGDIFYTIGIERTKCRFGDYYDEYSCSGCEEPCDSEKIPVIRTHQCDSVEQQARFLNVPVYLTCPEAEAALKQKEGKREVSNNM